MAVGQGGELAGGDGIGLQGIGQLGREFDRAGSVIAFNFHRDGVARGDAAEDRMSALTGILGSPRIVAMVLA